jgi:hypothetical protein
VIIESNTHCSNYHSVLTSRNEDELDALTLNVTTARMVSGPAES